MTLKQQVWTSTFGDVISHNCYCKCGVILHRDDPWHQGHVLANKHGGLAIIQNLRPICITCNLRMGIQNMYEYINDINDSSDLIKFEPREVQVQTLRQFEDCHIPRGIICAATGIGKTIIAMRIIGLHISGKILLWITRDTNVLRSQFHARNINSWKAAGYIPTNTHFLDWKQLKYYDTYEDTTIIYTTCASAKRYYESVIIKENFLGFVFDEFHQEANGDEMNNTLDDMANNADITRNNIFMLALSATPKITDKLIKVFGGYPKVYLNYNLYDALCDKIVRPFTPTYAIVKGITHNNCTAFKFNQVTNPKQVYDHIIKIADDSETGKGIIWCSDMHETNAWYNFFTQSAYTMDIPTYKFLKDYSGEDPKIFAEFAAAYSNAIMFACHKYRNGVDIKRLSFGGVIGNVSIQTLLQCVGRLIRIEPDLTFATICQFIIGDDTDESRLLINETIQTGIYDYYKGICGDEFEQVRQKALLSSRHYSDSLELSIGMNDSFIKFKVLGELNYVDAFKQDAETIMRFLRTCGIVITMDIVRKVIMDAGITDVNEAWKYLDKCVELSPNDPISKWWALQINKNINWLYILGQSESNYYNFEDAKTAIRKLLRDISDDIIITASEKWLYDYMCQIDLSLPPNPVEVYSRGDKKINITDLVKINWDDYC